MSILKEITQYIHSERSIIYINDFDFDYIDNIIKKAGNGFEILEFNQAEGLINFETKVASQKIKLDEFLALAKITEKATFLVLKDIHNYLEYNHPQNAEIISHLKNIALNKHVHIVIFIVSTKLVIPIELEKLITIVDVVRPEVKRIQEIIKSFAQENSFYISDNQDKKSMTNDNLIRTISDWFKGLSEFEIQQTLFYIYTEKGFFSVDDKLMIDKQKEQIIKKSGMLEVLNFKERIEDIGGLEKLINWMKRKAEIYNNIQDAKEFGVDIPKGVMIVGMPGCGKSLTAKAAANLFKAPLLRLDVGRLLGKYIGESEENLRRVIKVAEEISPCILWIDEIEKALSGIGDGGGASEVTTRIFGYFLTWLQEKESAVFVVATSNDISKLPPEFLRKGRFDEMFFVDFPDSHERKNIFEIHLKKRKKFNHSIDTKNLANITDKYSGSDIEGVVREVVENAFFNKKDQISTQDIINVINLTKPFASSLKEKVAKMKEELNKLDIKTAK